MAQDFARDFYNSPAWKAARNAYASKRHHLCEDCLARGDYRKGDIVHHVIALTPENIKDPEIALNEQNFRLVCRRCHKQIHDGEGGKRWTVNEWGKVKIR